MAPALASTPEQSGSMISVQELMKKHLTSVPPIYLIPGKDNLMVLNVQVSSPAIPTIDLNFLVSSDSELGKLHSACKEWGFFQLVNHGVSTSLMAKLRHDIEELYDLPLEDKKKYQIREDEVEGYGGLPRVRGQLDWGDRFYMLTNPTHARKPHLFPELPKHLRSTLEEYLSKMQKLGMKLITYMAKALKIEATETEEMFDDGFQSLKMTYYPPCPDPDRVMGITNHSDASGLTILNQVNGVDGLQVQKDGIWFPVNVLPDALVVNVGDILEIMTNGAYKSIVHRAAANPEKERISVAFFFSPRFEAEVGPVTNLIGPANPPMFETVPMEKYVQDLFSRKQAKSNLKLNHPKTEADQEADKHI